MLTDHRKASLIIVPLLLAAWLIPHDGVAIGLSVAALALTLVVLVAILRARRAARRDST